MVRSLLAKLELEHELFFEIGVGAGKSGYICEENQRYNQIGHYWELKDVVP